MVDPSFKLRVASSGPVVKGTPGNVLTFNADGESVSGQPGGGSIPLPIPIADLDAVGVPDGYVVVALDGLAQWAPVPTAFDITSFGLTGASLVQVGQTVTNPAFAAAYNQAATAASLTDTDGHNDALTLPATSFVSPHAFTKTAFGASEGFTLHAQSALGVDTAGATLVWGANAYFGTKVDPGVYDEAFIESLTAALRVGVGGSYTMPLVAGGKGFFCALTVLGLTIDRFFVGGFPWACSKVAAAVAVTNAFGVALTYDVFRADNIIPAAYQVDVS
jgi:hypothetical protein